MPNQPFLPYIEYQVRDQDISHRSRMSTLHAKTLAQACRRGRGRICPQSALMFSTSGLVYHLSLSRPIDKVFPLSTALSPAYLFMRCTPRLKDALCGSSCHYERVSITVDSDTSLKHFPPLIMILMPVSRGFERLRAASSVLARQRRLLSSTYLHHHLPSLGLRNNT